MASTAFLITAAVVLCGVLLVLWLALWWLVRATASGLPVLVPRLAGSRLWRSSASFRERTATRYPRAYGAVAARFSTAHFSGLHLTLVLIGALYALAMLGGLVDEVRENAGRIALDEHIDAFFAPYRVAWLLKAFLWITAIGAGPSLTALLCAATALLWSGGRAHLVPALWIAFVGAQATTWSSKYVIDRPRPVFLPDITEWNPSFPSGHATASTALIGMLGFIVATGCPTLRARFDVVFATAVIIGFVCFSRLFLGVHFFTDVAAGILVGGFWLLVGTSVAALWPGRVAALGPALGPATPLAPTGEQDRRREV